MHRWYTQDEIQFVKTNIKGRTYIDMTRLFNKRFGLGITVKQMEKLMYKHGLHNGIGSFNGGAPHNKGEKSYWNPGNFKPKGSERIINGYVEIKVDEHRLWKRKHTVIWEKANGNVPQGHVVIFGDGNKRNFELNNLLLVSRKELYVMNSLGLIYKHKDLTVVGKTIADIKITITRRKGKTKRRIKKYMMDKRIFQEKKYETDRNA